MKAARFYITFLISVSTAALASNASLAGDTPIADDAVAYFIWPKDGAVLKERSIWVRFGLRNAGIAPAGVERDNTGHHHLLIDTELPSYDEEIPADQNHVHFGKGQSEALIELPPGTHTLQMLFADHLHVPHSRPVLSEKITVTVQ